MNTEMDINLFCSNSSKRYGFSSELNKDLESCLLDFVETEFSSILILLVIN